MKSRRSFIKKIAAATSATALGVSNSFSSNKNSGMKEPVVKNIKPLGFQWETRDPFLFCVHHLDYYPKGNVQLGTRSFNWKEEISETILSLKDGWRMYYGETSQDFQDTLIVDLKQ